MRSARSMGAPEIDPGIERRWDRVWWGDVPRIGRNPKSILRGLAIAQRTVRSTHSTRDEWSGWNTVVTQRDVDRVLRRVNRRIETGVVALSKGSRCLEDDHSWREADVELEPDFTAPCAAHQTIHQKCRSRHITRIF